MKMREKSYSGTRNPEISEREKRSRRTARRAAAEGIVLMKNEGVLPLAPGSRVALFGSGAGRTIKGGTGSGDVNEREKISIYQGLLNAGIGVSSTGWIEDYERRYQQSREDWKNLILGEAGDAFTVDFFQVYANHAYRMPDGRSIEAADFQGADTAIYVISRVSGEGADRREDAGDYYLTQHEKEDLAVICRYSQKVAVILNAGGQIDLSDLRAFPQVKALLFIGQPGMEGGNAVADVLTGAVIPGGKLTDTWAVSYQDFPNAKTFSHQNGNVTTEKYEEGIFVGYRYFDSFQVEPEYPFGFGLSYTEFSLEPEALAVQGGSRVELELSVKNTGTGYAGKETAQLYVTPPRSGLPKEYRRLCAYAKTKLLAPGESQKLKLSFPLKNLASFDEARSVWVLEKGLYGVWTGNSSRNLALAGVLEAEEDLVLEQVRHICPLQEELKEILPDETQLRSLEEAWQREAKEKGFLPVKLWLADGASLEKEKDSLQASDGDAKRQETLALEARKLAEQLSDEELITMVVGEVSKNQNNALGSAGIMVPGSAGETSRILEDKWQVPGVPMADGPAGLRLIKKYQVDRKDGQIHGFGFLEAMEDGLFAPKREVKNGDTYYQYCTAFPVGVSLAQTWDDELLEEVGTAVAEEMREFGVAWWLAPGMNIHRNPLCGRNFEYFAEDPLVSGRTAAAITRGVQSLGGTGTTIKHFACNNQEDNRMGSNSILSERALREIYLRGFEIAVKTAQPMAIMTSYNRINGVHSANNPDICTIAAREEWGFQGFIMTDWTTTSPQGGSLAWKCVQAGNDLIMPGEEPDKENIRQALENGQISREELRACVARLLKVIFQTLVYEDCGIYGKQFELE